MTRAKGATLAAVLCVAGACGGGETQPDAAPPDAAGAGSDAPGAGQRPVIGRIRIYRDAVLGEFRQGATIFRAPEAPDCVIHVGGEVYSSAGTLTVGGPIVGAPGGPPSPIVPALDSTVQYVYFGSTLPPDDSRSLEVSLTGSGPFPAMPVLALRPPAATPVVVTSPAAPADPTVPTVIPSTEPYEVRWTAPEGQGRDHRITVSIDGIGRGASKAAIHCGFPAAAGRGVIPVSLLAYVRDREGSPASGYMTIGAGDWKEHVADDASYVIEVTHHMGTTQPELLGMNVLFSSTAPPVTGLVEHDVDDPASVVVDAEGSAWVTTGFESRDIIRITRGGAITPLQVPSARPGLAGIVFVPETDAVWFSQMAAGRIGKITRDGALSDIAVPSADGRPPTPWSLLYRPASGDLVIGMFVDSRLGVLTLPGSITYIPLPQGARANQLALGPDGRTMFFTDTAGDRVGRMDMEGRVTLFAVPTVSGAPWGIVLGSDGNLWITEATGNKVARMTPEGQFTEFPIPTPVSGATRIVRAGDVLYYATAANRIGKVTMDGMITEKELPFGIDDIAVAPDGRLWFTSRHERKIGNLPAP